MPEWVLVFVVMTSGAFWVDAKMGPTVPMQTRDACANFGRDLVQNSTRQMGALCISTSTGEVVSFQGIKK